MPALRRWSGVLALAVALMTGAEAARAAAVPDSPEQRSLVHLTRMEVVHGRPYVMVMIDGKGPFRFLIDTGTGGQAMVTTELADELGLPTVGHARLTDPSGLGDQRADFVLIDSLNVAGVEFSGVHAVRHELFGEGASCQGLLGFPLFKDFLLKLDYPHEQMSLSTGALKPDGGNRVLPFRMPEGVPIAPLRVGDLDVEAQFDSGGTGLSLPERLASQLKFAAGPVDFSRAESLATRFLIRAARLGSDVQLGHYRFTEPFVEINDAFPLVNFGSSAMQNFSVTFDQSNLLLKLEARNSTMRLAPEVGPLRMESSPRERRADTALIPID